MKFVYVLLLFISNALLAQEWQVEIMGGVSGYNGDLTKQPINIKTFGPMSGIGVKRSFYQNKAVLRAELNYGHISGDDNYNTDRSLIRRNLNFQTDIIEANISAEYNILNPAEYMAFPYIFAGVGLFHFNPYTYDRFGKKSFLQPLGTEGQGLQQFPDRKMYPLTQLCLPYGLGWKLRINQSFEIVYEVGVRFLFTDYLDDVSKTYVDPEVLLQARGQTSAELSFRQTTPTGRIDGLKRGNAKAHDQYFFTGFKLVIKLNNEDAK